MRKLIHINNTYITSVDELRDVMRANYTNQNLRRDILSFFKDGVLQEWFKEEGEPSSVKFSPIESLSLPDNDVYDEIHAQIDGTHVKEQIKSDFYTYLSLIGVAYKTTEVKSAEMDAKSDSYIVPKAAKIITFTFRLLRQDNNDFTLDLAGKKEVIHLAGKKRGETVAVSFNCDNIEKSADLIEGISNKLCSVSLKDDSIPASIVDMMSSMKTLESGNIRCKFTETMVTQRQYRDVMKASSIDMDGGANFPAYLTNRSDCYKFILELNRLTRKHFKLPTEEIWRVATDGEITSTTLFMITYYCHIDEPREVKGIPHNLKDIYNTTSNIPEFLDNGYVRKGSLFYCIDVKRPGNQIGFHLVEGI